MPTLVSTGQLTIIDQNDAKPITVFIGASSNPQQIYSLNNGVTTYLPDWTTSNVTLTAYVYVGSTTNVAASLTNKKWSLSAGGSTLPSGTSHTYVISTNTPDPETVASRTYYFEGEYLDPTTLANTKVIASIVTGSVKAGDAAVYVSFRGGNVIEQANGATKNVVAIGADLVRNSGYDTNNLEFEWFEAGGSTKINSAAGMAAKYGLKTTTAGSNPIGVASELGVNLPNTTADTKVTHNTLVIGESAVTDLAVFKVQITDTAASEVGKTWAGFFTVFDATDPYDLQLVSSTGDKLVGGVGSTEIYPRVFDGAVELGFIDNVNTSDVNQKASIFQGWVFDYTYYDRNGKRGAFIDTTLGLPAAGIDVNSSTANSGSTFTITLASGVTVIAGTIVKLVKNAVVDPTLTAEFYEVHANATNATTITLKNSGYTTANNWLTWTGSAVANNFGNAAATPTPLPGKFFICAGTNGKITKTVASTGINTSAQAIAARKITVTGYDIDSKGTIVCEANRP